MFNYKRLVGVGAIGRMLVMTPNLYAQREERLSNRDKELERKDLEKIVDDLLEINKLVIGLGQTILRYTVYLATTEGDVKRPEVFEEIFDKLDIPFRPIKGTTDEKYDFYLKQFDKVVVDSYPSLTKQKIEHISNILFEYFSEKDKQEFEKVFGVKPGEQRVIEFKLD